MIDDRPDEDTLDRGSRKGGDKKRRLASNFEFSPAESEEPTPSPSPERSLRRDSSSCHPEDSNVESNDSWIIGYKGNEKESQVVGLMPGTRYRFTVRAFNTAGPGPWSDILVAESGPGSPAGVLNARADVNSAGNVVVNWEPPANDGGSDVTW